MHLNHSMKLCVTFSIIIFLIIGFILPSSVLAIDIDAVDGIWSDSFDNSTTTRFINGTSKCVWNNGQIQLIKSSEGGRNYTFAGGSSSLHQAYYNTTVFSLNGIFGFLLTPRRLSRSEFDPIYDYPYIVKFNESKNKYTRYAITESKGYRKNVIHHFRITLGSADSIGNLGIYWYGRADNAKNIRMYYWQYRNVSFLSSWKEISYTNKSGDVILFYNLSHSNLTKALDSENNIDICVVAYASTTPCTLYTDFIVLKSSNQEGYKEGYGLAQTKFPINLKNLTTNGYWEFLTWDDYTSGSATVKYQVLYDNGTAYVPVKNSILNGNEQGFDTPPVSLTPLGANYPLIKIQANLSTNDPTITPRIFSWTVTWQTGNKWQDHFHSDYRIAVKNNVNVETSLYNGTVNISLVSGDWPMFGQNPGNTRASSGSAAFTSGFYWWSAYHELKDQTPLTLVLDGNSLYVTTKNNSMNNGSVFRYSPVIVPADKTGHEYGEVEGYLNINDFLNLTAQQKNIIGSPAISDQYLVVATGNLGSKNYVYAFNKDRPDWKPNWTFDFSANISVKPDICYWGSPTIAEGHVYLTTWSGDTSLSGFHTNNMILALDLANGDKIWNFTFPPSLTPARSSTWSFSTPAYSDGKVVVGCMNDLSDNLFAFDANNGTLLWNTSVGAIGKAAPVIYNNIVYIVSENKTLDGLFKKAMLSAISLDDGTVRWQVSLGKKKYAASLDPTFTLAQTTPVIANGILYVTSPDWYLTAFDLSKNNTALWTKLIPGGTLSGPKLTSSPAYADGILYVGTPAGRLWAFNTSTNGSELWHVDTHNYPAVVTDPIVSNGLVFFADENGRLYVCGKYVQPNNQVNGSIISVPIQLPQGFWWKKFYTFMQTNRSTTVNWITFSLLDANKNLIKTLTNRSDLALSNGTLPRTIRLRADFWAKNSTVNPKLFLWNVTFIQDLVPPFINRSSLNPKINPKQWLNEVIPQFTIKVKDNITGLLVSSAQYTLEYVSQNVTYHYTGKASCTGVNGTTDVQLMTVNLSTLDFYNNITALHTLQFNISDLAGNLQSLKVTLQQDTQKPSSHILTPSMKKRYNATNPFIWINATAYDNGTNPSGVAEVQLYYRYSPIDNFSGDWILFANSSSRTPRWRFDFTDDPSQPGGYFELTTIAIDNATNMEDFPAKGNVSFLYDWTIPDLPNLSGETLWFNERPQFSATFTDDFQVDTVQYRPNLDTVWTTLASKINKSSYHATWQLKVEYWDRMQSGAIYYLYFKINDTSGNTRLVTDNSKALIIRKDIEKPNVTIEVPNAQNQLITTGNFTISAFANDFNGSGISEVALYYQYSKDNRSWTEWIHYDDNLTAAPFEWMFTTPEGTGTIDSRSPPWISREMKRSPLFSPLASFACRSIWSWSCSPW